MLAWDTPEVYEPIAPCQFIKVRIEWMLILTYNGQNPSQSIDYFQLA